VSVVFLLKLCIFLTQFVFFIGKMLVFHIVIRLCIDVSEHRKSLFIPHQSFSIPLTLEEHISLYFDFFTQMHLNHVMLFPDNLIFFGVIKSRFKVLW